MGEDYVTKQDLAEHLAAQMDKIVGLFHEFQRNIIGHMEENFATKMELKNELAATEERINEKIHDTETRLLRGYEHHARATESHLKTLDGHTAANFLGAASLAERMAVLEARMLDLEMGRRPPQ